MEAKRMQVNPRLIVRLAKTGFGMDAPLNLVKVRDDDYTLTAAIYPEYRAVRGLAGEIMDHDTGDTLFVVAQYNTYTTKMTIVKGGDRAKKAEALIRVALGLRAREEEDA